MLKIIDISEANGIIYWPDVKNQIDGVILRVGYRGYGAAGSLMFDRLFHHNVAYLQSLGIPFGVYWLSQAISVEEAEAEADFVHEHIKHYTLQLPVFLDSEWGDANGGTGRADRISRNARTEYALALLRRLRELGYDTGLYTGVYWFRDSIDGEAIRADGNAIWLASVENIEPAIPYDAWQYSWKGQLDGINTDVDMNQFRPSLMRSMGKYYIDTKGHWAEEAIDKVTDAGFMKGKADKRFDPEGKVTRAELATVLARMLDRM